MAITRESERRVSKIKEKKTMMDKNQGRLVRTILYNNTLYEVREESIDELIACAQFCTSGTVSSMSTSPDATTIIDGNGNLVDNIADNAGTHRSLHHTQRWRVRFEEPLSVDSTNKLTTLQKDESFISRGRIELGENEFAKFTLKKKCSPKLE